MELVSQIPLVGPTLAVVIPFLLVLAVVVFVHEFGHYIVGRWCGIGAETFSVGFGREIWGFTDRRGTRWRLSALPLGGYVKFVGDADASSSHVDPDKLAALSPRDRARSFHGASVGRRALTVAAGPVANFLLSVALFAVMGLGMGAQSTEPVIGALSDDANPELREALRPGDRVVALDGAPVADFAALHQGLLAREGGPVVATILRAEDGAEAEVSVTFRPPARVDGVSAGGAAAEAGLLPGDVIEAADGAPVSGFAELQRLTRASEGRPMALTVRRGDATLEVAITPRRVESVDPLTGRPVARFMLGIEKRATEIVPPVETMGPFAALGHGVERTWAVVSLSLRGFADVIMGTQPAGEVIGGPIRIAQVSGDAAAQGFAAFVGLVAVLSTAIGLINLFPIPVLDGGHLMFYAIEAARGRPLRERWLEISNSIGLALVLSLMIFSIFNDITRQ
jgi:regulator of sigma E protease